jgi:predicted DNA-binding protein with PD1-like motif
MIRTNQFLGRLTLVPLLAFMAAGSLAAQETRRETVNASANPADDAKANSDDVPDVYSIPTDFQRVITLRFKHRTDLLAGLEKIVKQENIRNAVILSGAGSVVSYHVHQVGNRTFPSKNIYVKDPTAAADLLTVTGYVIGGRVHAHVTLATPEKAFGGHLEPGTEVFTFAIVTVGVLSPTLDLSRLDDKTYR